MSTRRRQRERPGRRYVRCCSVRFRTFGLYFRVTIFQIVRSVRRKIESLLARSWCVSRRLSRGGSRRTAAKHDSHRIADTSRSFHDCSKRTERSDRSIDRSFACVHNLTTATSTASTSLIKQTEANKMTVSHMPLPLASRNIYRHHHSGFYQQQQEKMLLVKQPQQSTTTHQDRDDDESSTVSIHQQDEKPQELAEESSVFRRRMDAESDDQEGFWTLKRANPVFEEDDDDDEHETYESPTKRQCQELSWDDCRSSSVDKPFQLNVSSSGQFFHS